MKSERAAGKRFAVAMSAYFAYAAVCCYIFPQASFAAPLLTAIIATSRRSADITSFFESILAASAITATCAFHGFLESTDADIQAGYSPKFGSGVDAQVVVTALSAVFFAVATIPFWLLMRAFHANRLPSPADADLAK